ncbi:hypothetical protein [Cerasicoccus fimbriatus]|uniref:hypothetical protein n=1 Tax=Cerasicoccus fimbriatus TaxID=3014554 RepID=UPI0022B550BE|nr:hypothetical protein [Cerasicoccus sp. TK19100]
MNENLAQSTSLEITLAHLLVLRELASDKLAGTPLNLNFSEIEKKAIWILEDVIDQKLMDLKIESRPAKDWDELTSRAAKHLETQPCDFLP